MRDESSTVFSVTGVVAYGLFLRIEYNRNKRFNFVGKRTNWLGVDACRLTVTWPNISRAREGKGAVVLL